MLGIVGVTQGENCAFGLAFSLSRAAFNSFLVPPASKGVAQVDLVVVAGAGVCFTALLLLARSGSAINGALAGCNTSSGGDAGCAAAVRSPHHRDSGFALLVSRSPRSCVRLVSITCRAGAPAAHPTWQRWKNDRTVSPTPRQNAAISSDTAAAASATSTPA